MRRTSTPSLGPVRRPPAPACGRSGSTWAWAMPWTSSTRPGVRRTGSSHGDDLVALESVASLHSDAATFEAWLRSVLQPRESTQPGVLLSTIHKIKGREWDRVVVFGVSQGLLPHRLGNDLDAERRVLHVGMTRARVQTVLVADSSAPSEFLDEVSGTRSREVRAAPPRPALSAPGTLHHRSGSRSDRRGRDGRRPVESKEIEAIAGLLLSRGGTQGEIVEVNESGAAVQVGNLRERVSFGTAVTVEGKLVTLVSPREPNPLGTERLRQWRSTVSSAEKMPAYLVLSDKDLTGIAVARPRTLAELAGCKGIGPHEAGAVGRRDSCRPRFGLTGPAQVGSSSPDCSRTM